MSRASAKKRSPWNLAILDLGNGYVYAATRIQVENDYADYLMQADGLSYGHAVERARDAPDEIDTWVREQFNSGDFERLGIMLQRPSYERMVGQGNYTDTHPQLKLITV